MGRRASTVISTVATIALAGAAVTAVLWGLPGGLQSETPLAATSATTPANGAASPPSATPSAAPVAVPALDSEPAMTGADSSTASPGSATAAPDAEGNVGANLGDGSGTPKGGAAETAQTSAPSSAPTSVGPAAPVSTGQDSPTTGEPRSSANSVIATSRATTAPPAPPTTPTTPKPPAVPQPPSSPQPPATTKPATTKPSSTKPTATKTTSAKPTATKPPTVTTASQPPQPDFTIPVTLGTATQLITVTSTSAGATTATLRAWQKQPDGTWTVRFGPVKAYVGKEGIGPASEYASRTPRGTFTMTEAFGRLADPGTALPYHLTGPNDWWVSDTKSPTYNTMQTCVKSACSFNTRAAEHLRYITPYYDYAVVMDVNRSPAVPGGGSAFFLHVSVGAPTEGCVAIDKATLVSILRWLDPAQHPRIATGVG